MDIVILDLEWNQPLVSKKRVKGLIGEIIQIGAVRVDYSMNVSDSFERTIKPVHYLRMNKEIQELTLITDEELQSGASFQEAIEDFRSWCGKDCVFVTWGPDDRLVLLNNLEMFEMDTTWLPDVYDGQLMFDDQEMQEDRQWPLNYALYHYNEKPDGVHNALADVYNTAQVLKHLDMEECLRDEYFICGSEEKEEDDN